MSLGWVLKGSGEVKTRKKEAINRETKTTIYARHEKQFKDKPFFFYFGTQKLTSTIGRRYH